MQAKFEVDNIIQKWLLMMLKIYMMVKDNPPFIVRHARVWSRASTGQLVPGSRAAVQCSKQ